MKKNSTQNPVETMQSPARKNSGEQMPKRSTIEFIRQFARCYQHEAAVEAYSGTIILN